MKLSLIRFYEGNNIKRKKRIVRIVLEHTSDAEAKIYLKNYFRVCFILGFEEKLVDIEKTEEGFNIWVTYSFEELSKYILKNLICEKYNIDKVAKGATKLVFKGFTINIAKEAPGYGIPVIELSEGVFQLGYGANSVVISKDYQNFETTEKVKLTENMKTLWQQLRYGNIPKVDGYILYCKNDAEEIRGKLLRQINIRSITKESGINIKVNDGEEFYRVIENMLDVQGRVFVYCGSIHYRIISFKGKAGLVFKHDDKNETYEEVKFERRFQEITEKVYNIFNIKFMYIDVQENDILRVVDAGSVFSIGHLLMGMEKRIRDYFLINLKNEKIGTIPIISVSGTNGKTTTTRIIYYTLNQLGYVTGLTSTGGVFIKDEKIKNGDTTGFLSAREVLMNKKTEAAVFETARGGILKNGLGYEMAKVGVIMSLSEDHIGMEGIKTIHDLGEIKAVVLHELENSGKMIIRAQEELISLVFEENMSALRTNDSCSEIRSDLPCYASAAKLRYSNIALFSIEKNEYIEEYIRTGGEALYMEKDNIIYCRDGVEGKLVDVKELPFTHNGCSKGNILNIMAAVSSVYAIYPNLQKIIEVIKELKCDLCFNPGRQNIIDIKDFKIILDYGHNSEAFKEVFSIAKSLKPSKLTSIIAAPGDRMDRYIEELGNIAAENSDYIIIREQADLRGRKPGESAKLIENGVMKSGFDMSNVETIFKEEEAIVYAMEKAQKNEVVVLFTQCLDVIIPAINDYLKSVGEDPIGEGLDFTH